MKRRIENRVITCYFTAEELNRIVMLLGENAVCMKLPSYMQLKNYIADILKKAGIEEGANYRKVKRKR